MAGILAVRKGFTHWVVVIIITILAITVTSAAWYYEANEGEEKTISPKTKKAITNSAGGIQNTNISNDTIDIGYNQDSMDLEQFINEKYQVSFKYPQQYSLEEEISDTRLEITITDKPYEPSADALFLEVQPGFSFKSYVWNHKDEYPDGCTEDIETQLGGNYAVSFECTESFASGTQANVVGSWGDDVYHFHYITVENKVNKVFDKIIESFEFYIPELVFANWSATKFWIVQNFNNPPTVSIFDVANDTVTSLSEYPMQGANSGNYIIQPQGNKMSYFQRDENNENWDLIVANTDGTSEKVITSGFRCLDGPCDIDQSLGLGELSSDGKFLSYVNQGSSSVINLDTNEVYTVPMDEYIPVQFAGNTSNIFYLNRKGSFFHGTIGDSELKEHTVNSEHGTRYSGFDSPDGLLLAIISSEPGLLSIYSFTTGELIDSIKYTDFQGSNLISALRWVSDTSFVINGERDINSFFVEDGSLLSNGSIYDEKKSSDVYSGNMLVAENQMMVNSGKKLIVIELSNGIIQTVFESDNFFLFHGAL